MEDQVLLVDVEDKYILLFLRIIKYRIFKVVGGFIQK
jgi:hypothetical protein